MNNFFSSFRDLFAFSKGKSSSSNSVNVLDEEISSDDILSVIENVQKEEDGDIHVQIDKNAFFIQIGEHIMKTPVGKTLFTLALGIFGTSLAFQNDVHDFAVDNIAARLIQSIPQEVVYHDALFRAVLSVSLNDSNVVLDWKPYTGADFRFYEVIRGETVIYRTRNQSEVTYRFDVDEYTDSEVFQVQVVTDQKTFKSNMVRK